MSCKSFKKNEDAVIERIRYCANVALKKHPFSTVAITKYIKEDTHKLLSLGEYSFKRRAIFILKTDLHRRNYYTYT